MTKEEHREYSKKWYQAHRAEILAKRKEQYWSAPEEHRERSKEITRRYRSRMSEEQKKASAEYNRKYREDNREVLREYQREWRKANPDKVAGYKQSESSGDYGAAEYLEPEVHITRSIRSADKGKIGALLRAGWTVSEIANDMGLNEDDLKTYLEEING